MCWPWCPGIKLQLRQEHSGGRTLKAILHFTHHLEDYITLIIRNSPALWVTLDLASKWHFQEDSAATSTLNDPTWCFLLKIQFIAQSPDSHGTRSHSFLHQVASPPIFLKCKCLVDGPNPHLQKSYTGNNHHFPSNLLPSSVTAQDLLLPQEPLDCAPILVPPLISEELRPLSLIIIYPSIHPSTQTSIHLLIHPYIQSPIICHPLSIDPLLHSSAYVFIVRCFEYKPCAWSHAKY